MMNGFQANRRWKRKSSNNRQEVRWFEFNRTDKKRTKDLWSPEVTLQGQDTVWWIKTLWEYKYRTIENPRNSVRKRQAQRKVCLMEIVLQSAALKVSEVFFYFLCFFFSISLLLPLIPNSKHSFNRKPLTSSTFTQWIFEPSTRMHNHPHYIQNTREGDLNKRGRANGKWGNRKGGSVI